MWYLSHGYQAMWRTSDDRRERGCLPARRYTCRRSVGRSPKARATTIALAGALLLAPLGACASKRILNQCALPAAHQRPAPHADRAITVLSYNLKGLPALFGGGDNAARYRAIANTLRVYDVVALQELFVDRSYLVRHLPGEHSVAFRSSARPLFSRTIFGNGLAIVGRSDRLLHREVSDRRFNVCEGWGPSGGSDCFSRKGVIAVPYVLANGDTLHVVNLHMDAGARIADRQARALQLEEVRDFIVAKAGDGPLVVMGDFNIDRATPDEIARFERFRASLGLIDTGTLRHSACVERLDYILFRSGRSTQFQLYSTGVDALAMGSPALSDHPPIFAVLGY